MSFLLKRKRLATLALTWLIVLSLSLGALAHAADSPSVPDAQWFSTDAGIVPLSDDELAQISGEVNPVVASAVSGAVYAAFEYATSPGEKTVIGLVKQTATGAIGGAILGTAATLNAATKVAKVLEDAVSVAWTVWGSANAGAITGAVKQLIGD